MNHDVTSNQGFAFHDFATDRTLGLTIFKNNRMNNLQQYLKFKIYSLSIGLMILIIYVLPNPELTFQNCKI
jgi:hypothetical protein